MSNKLTPILILGFIGFAGYKIYFKEFDKPDKEALLNKVETKIDLTNVPRVTMDDMLLGKSCNTPVITCEELGLQEDLSEGLIFKENILYIIKNVKNTMHDTRQPFFDLEIPDKAEGIAYATIVNPKLLGKLKFESKIYAIRVFAIEVEFAMPKLIQGFELTKEKSEKIQIGVSNILPNEIFINGNIKLARDFFKDKVTTVTK